MTIIGVSSDIGRALAERYHRDGFTVVGTYRDPKGIAALKDFPTLHLYQCDVQDRESVSRFVEGFAQLGSPWDILISSVGSQMPIGRFFAVDFEEWAASVGVNAIDQLRVIHRLYPFRNAGASLVFFAGGGTNNPMTNYSAYCVSKIMLIKMCELLDDEDPSLKTFIVGPGWVRTKIHQQTMANPEGAGRNYLRTGEFLRSGNPGTSMDDIYSCISWLVQQERAVASGRNFSVVYDRWGTEELREKLVAEPNMYKLRRFGNDWLAGK